MAELSDKIIELKLNLKEYVNIHCQIAILKVSGIASSLMAKILAGFVFASILFLFLIFIGITGGYYFATLTGSNEKGFLIVAAIFLIVALILIIFRQKLVINPIRNNLIKHLLNNDK